MAGLSEFNIQLVYVHLEMMTMYHANLQRFRHTTRISNKISNLWC